MESEFETERGKEIRTHSQESRKRDRPGSMIVTSADKDQKEKEN